VRLVRLVRRAPYALRLAPCASCAVRLAPCALRLVRRAPCALRLARPWAPRLPQAHTHCVRVVIVGLPQAHAHCVRGRSARSCTHCVRVGRADRPSGRACTALLLWARGRPRLPHKPACACRRVALARRAVPARRNTSAQRQHTKPSATALGAWTRTAQRGRLGNPRGRPNASETHAGCCEWSRPPAPARPAGRRACRARGGMRRRRRASGRADPAAAALPVGADATRASHIAGSPPR
jgi:hypothetical protein